MIQQNIHKDSDFEVTDRIVVTITDHEVVRKAVGQFKEYICNEVLADEILLNANDGAVTEIVEGVDVGIEVGKV